MHIIASILYITCVSFAISWGVLLRHKANTNQDTKEILEVLRIGIPPIVINALNRTRYTFDMLRTPKAVAMGFPHHVTQRRNNLERLFEDKSDFRQYLG